MKVSWEIGYWDDTVFNKLKLFLQIPWREEWKLPCPTLTLCAVAAHTNDLRSNHFKFWFLIFVGSGSSYKNSYLCCGCWHKWLPLGRCCLAQFYTQYNYTIKVQYFISNNTWDQCDFLIDNTQIRSRIQFYTGMSCSDPQLFLASSVLNFASRRLE